jgi:hypothetical protein
MTAHHFFRVFWPTHVVFQRNVMGFCCLRSGSLVSVAASCQASPHDDNSNIWVHVFLLSHPYLRFWLTHILPIWKRGPGGSTADQHSKLFVRQHQTSKSEFGWIVSRICHFIGVSYPFFYCPPVFGWTAHQRQRVSLPRSCWKDSEKQACLSAKKCGCKKQRCGDGVPMELLNPWRF